MLQRCQLKAVKRDMGRIEINSRDVLRSSHKITCDVAATRGNGNHAVSTAQAQSIHINDGVFPNLGINKAAKQERKKPLKHALAGHDVILMHSFSKMLTRLACRSDKLIHGQALSYFSLQAG